MSQNVSELDIKYLEKLRNNVEIFMAYAAKTYGKNGLRLLDIAPQDHLGAAPFFHPLGVIIDTLDINPDSGATFIADLCQCAEIVGFNRYDYIVCTEVLEHTRQPFDAVSNMFEILKPGGMVFASTPFNFRIHGPLPDCWRFTEYGLRELFKDFSSVEITALETDARFLMPLQYTLVAKK